MQTYIPENAPIRTVQTMIDEAKALGLRVTHRPDPKPSNVIQLSDADNNPSEHLRMQMCVSPEAA